jgi:hypothetical protein
MIAQLENRSGRVVAGSEGNHNYDGPECRRVLYQLDELTGDDYNAKPTTTDLSAEAQVLLQICIRREKDGYYNHTIPQHPRIAELSTEEAWFSQDDWKLDVVSAAVFASGAAVKRARGEDYITKADVGLALFFTRIIPPEALEQGLATVRLPPAARSAMVALYRAVPARLGPALGEDDRKILVDVPVEIYEQRRAHYAMYRKMYEQFDQLRAEAEAMREDPMGIDRVAADLQHLRSKFFTACGKIECRALPLYAHATRELAQLYVLRGNALAARTESFLYADYYVAGFPQAIRAAQQASLQAMTEAWETYRKAKENGSDERTALRLAGNVPAKRPDLRILEPKLALPNYAAALGERGVGPPSNAFVDHVAGSGATRTLVFKTDVYASEESYDCVRTNRISRIHRDGTIEYEEDCKTRPTRGSHLQHAPITVPATEVVAIRPGDDVEFMGEGNKALVIAVRRGDQTVQVRGDHVR